MGIDKPDVRTIIHYGAPQDIETYYQEIGRAGRDGMPSKCYVLYKHSDFNTNRYFLNDIKSEKFKDHKLQMLVKMEQYLASSKCRRRVLISHFAKKVPTGVGGGKSCCDNCVYKSVSSTPHPASGGHEETDSSVDQAQVYYNAAKLLLGLISDCPRRKSFGLLTYIFTLRGSKGQKMPYWTRDHESHGAGLIHPERWWREFGYQLKMQNLLEERAITGGFGSVVKISKKGRRWLNKATSTCTFVPLPFIPSATLLAIEKPRALQQPRSHLPSSSAGAAASTTDALLSPTSTASGSSTDPLYLPTTENRDAYKVVQVERKVIVQPPPEPAKDAKAIETENLLYNELLTFRGQLAHEAGIAPFLVGNNRLLGELAKTRPSSLELLSKVEGVSEVWLKQYGSRMLQKIDEFCKKREESMRDVFTTDPVQAQPQEVMKKFDIVTRCSPPTPLTSTQITSYQFFNNDNMTVEAIAESRGLSPQTILGHLAAAMEAGHFVDYRRAGLTVEKEEMITQAIRKEPICSDISTLKSIREQLPPTIMYGDIHLTIAILAVKTGFVRPLKSSPPKFSFQASSSGSFTSPPPPPLPSLTRSTSTPTYSYKGRGSGGWSGKGNWQRGKGTKRKLPSSFKSGSHSSGYGGKPKSKSKKFW